MNNRIISATILSISLLLLGAGCATNKTDQTPTEKVTQTNTAPLTYDTIGLTPKQVTISTGDSIEFRNSDLKSHWPASAPHPTHSDYPEFNPNKELAPGDVWKFTFTKPGTWKFHDELNPNDARFEGEIIVK